MNAVVLALLAGSAFAMNVNNGDASWQKPIQKVIGLLQDMETQLKKEADEDAEMFEEMGCWCETNDKEKTKAIEDAKNHIEKLTAAIEAGTAKSSQLETDLDKLAKDIAKQTSALEQATAIRSKENAEFTADQKDMAAYATSLKGAVEALGAAHPGAALSQATLMQVRAVLKKHAEQHQKMFSSKQHRAVLSLIQEKDTELYAPESGAIFGVLKQMKEGFETNMADSASEEKQALSEYTSMKEAKDAQIKAAEDLSSSKTVELGDTEAALAAAKQDLEDTTAQLAADTKFLENVKSTCATADADYEAQTSFSKSTSFIQMRSRTHRMSSEQLKREKLTHLLKKEADKYEFCTSEIKANEKDTAAKTDLKAELEQTIDDLSSSIATLTDEIAALAAFVAQTNVEMKAD